MIDFEYHNPTSLDEVFELLDQYGEDARVMAGGTALVTQMKHVWSSLPMSSDCVELQV